MLPGLNILQEVLSQDFILKPKYQFLAVYVMAPLTATGADYLPVVNKPFSRLVLQTLPREADDESIIRWKPTPDGSTVLVDTSTNKDGALYLAPIINFNLERQHRYTIIVSGLGKLRDGSPVKYSLRNINDPYIGYPLLDNTGNFCINLQDDEEVLLTDMKGKFCMMVDGLPELHNNRVSSITMTITVDLDTNYTVNKQWKQRCDKHATCVGKCNKDFVFDLTDANLTRVLRKDYILLKNIIELQIRQLGLTYTPDYMDLSRRVQPTVDNLDTNRLTIVNTNI